MASFNHSSESQFHISNAVHYIDSLCSNFSFSRKKFSIILTIKIKIIFPLFIIMDEYIY